MQSIIGIVYSPDQITKENIKIMNVSRKIIHDPRLGNDPKFTNKILKKIVKIERTF